MNRIEVIGNLGRDAEPKKIGEKFVYNCSIGVPTGNGENKGTAWYDLAIWRNDEKLGKFVKGTKLYVEGEPTVRAWQGKTGPAAAITINVHRFEFLSVKQEQQPTIEEVNTAQR